MDNTTYDGRISDSQQLKTKYQLLKRASWMMLFLSSTMTIISDPWLMEKKRRESSVTVSAYRPKLCRSITRAEALRISDEILEQAEKERRACAEYEAARGIQWDYQP